jgi:seryl-tRNA synthetase
MVLDIDEFRPEKGGNPEKIRENQRKRFSDVTMVDKIVESDEKWRKGQLLKMMQSTHVTYANYIHVWFKLFFNFFLIFMQKTCFKRFF